MTLSIIMIIIVIAFIVIQFAFLGKKKLLGLLLPLICFIGSIGIIISQPIMTDLVADGFNNGSHYYTVEVKKNNSTSQHIFQSENDKKEFINSLDSDSKVIVESEIQRPSEWYVYLGKFVICTNLSTIALLIIYMGKQLRNYADKKDKEEILTN